MYYTEVSLQPDVHEVYQENNNGCDFETATAYRAPIPLFKLLGISFLGLGWSYSKDTAKSEDMVPDNDEANLA